MKEKELEAGIYYRVSTREKQNIGMQQKACRDYCKRENIKIVKEYADKGISGKKKSRPEIDKLLEDMRSKKFDCVVVYKLDRIGRSLPHLVKLFEEFEKKRIKFISVTQNFDTTKPEGKLMLRMMMILAEYERELTVSRIKDGLKTAKNVGKRGKDKKKRNRSGYWLRWQKEKNRTTKKTTP